MLAGVAGLVAAIALTIEDFKRLVNPSYVPSCSINPVLSCGSVMATHQASVFGYPNPIMGLPTFAVVIATAMLVVAGVALPRWWWAGLTVGSAFGVGFVFWLIFQSLYRIHALCPYCMVVWTFTPIILLTAFNQLVSGAGGVLRFVADWRWTILIVYYAVVILLIYLQFQDYWNSLV
jgi:uncharacterized membrane protein